MAKQKGPNDGSEVYENAARAERRLLRDEERASKRLEKARARLVRAEEKLSRATERVEQRLAAVSVAEDELKATQQARAGGPISAEEEAPKEQAPPELDQPEAARGEPEATLEPMPPPQDEAQGSS